MTRTWTGLDNSGAFGNGWMATDLPYLMLDQNQFDSGNESSGIVTAENGAMSQFSFILPYGQTGEGGAGGSYQPLGSAPAQLIYTPSSGSGQNQTPGTFQLYDSAGGITTFLDLPRNTQITMNSGGSGDSGENPLTNVKGYPQEITSQDSSSAYPFGAFLSYRDPGGNLTQATYNPNTGNLLYVTETDATTGVAQRFKYDYGNASPLQNTCSEVDFQQLNPQTQQWTTIRYATYSYYTGQSSDSNYGRIGDLRLVQIYGTDNHGNFGIINQDYYQYYQFPTQVYSGPGSPPINPIDVPGQTGGTDTTFPPVPITLSNEADVVMSGLRLVVQGASFDRMYGAIGANYDNQNSVSDSSLTPYANYTFQYQRYDQFSLQRDPAGEDGASDDKYRVIQETAQGQGCSSCSGGVGTYSYSYETNPSGALGATDQTNFPNPNTWVLAVTETLPGDATTSPNDTETVYLNGYGEVMLTAVTDGVSGVTDLNYYQYNTQGQLVVHAFPSAVQGYSTSYSGLVGSIDHDAISYPVLDAAVDLLPDSGEIETFQYYAATSNGLGNGTSGNTQNGGVANYFESSSLQNGRYGTPALQEYQTYYQENASFDGVTFSTYPLATMVEYRNATTDVNDLSAEITSYTYSWFTNTSRPSMVTTTMPVVSAAENGPGPETPEVTQTYYDEYGQPTWTVDGAGYIDYAQYDPLTGAVLVQITDADPSQIDDTTVPSSVLKPTRSPALPAALSLTTTTTPDAFGRSTEVVNPNGHITYTVYNDLNHETRVYPGWTVSYPNGPSNPVYSTTSPIQVTTQYDDGIPNAQGVGAVFTQTLTSSATPTVNGNGQPTGDEVINDGNIQTLSRQLTNNAGQVVESDQYFSLAGVSYTAQLQNPFVDGVESPWLGNASNNSASGNYYPTLTAYDARGRVDRVEDPTGTITRTIYNVWNLPVSVWVGTDDQPTNGLYWSPNNNVAGANMVDTTDNIYDYGGSGDGNLTQVTQHPHAGDAQLDRVTEYYYDWRDRKVVEKDGVQATETTNGGASDGVHRPLYYYIYDNLNELTETDQYDGDGLYDYAGPSPSFVNGGFESPHVSPQELEEGLVFPTHSGIPGWSFVDTTSEPPQNGVYNISNNAASDEPTAPEGEQVAVLSSQLEDPSDTFTGSMSQTVPNWSVGTYTISFQMAEASNFGFGNDPQNFEIEVDGNPVGPSGGFTPSSTTFSQGSATFSISTAGSHTISFLCVNPPSNGDEASVYLDELAITGGPGAPTPIDGVPVSPSTIGAKLVAKTVTSYDNQGRVYRTQVFSVDPTTGATSTATGAMLPGTLETDTYYDLRGNVIETRAPGGQVTKTVYDGADRPTAVYTTDGAGAEGEIGGGDNNLAYSDASIPSGGTNNVNGDHVLTQTLTVYDKDGNAIETITNDRDHNDSATATGALGDKNGNGGPAARVSYSGSFYDAVDRDIADVNIGTNGGQNPATSGAPNNSWWGGSTPPTTRSSTVLITNNTYGTDGWLDGVTDPKGIVTNTTYDMLGRPTEVIGNDTSPFNQSNSTQTSYTYDGNSNVLTMTAFSSSTGDQTTQYNYGVTATTGGSSITSNDLLGSVEYPAPSGGTIGQPSTSQEETYSYDALGEPTGYTDRNGTTHAYSYDVLGRLTLDAVSMPTGSAVDDTIDELGYTFNSQGLPYQYTSYSLQNNAQVVANQVQDTYNGYGQLTDEQQSHSGAVGSGTPAVQYTYDSSSNFINESRLVSMTYPGGRQIDYSYAPISGDAGSALDNAISRVSSIIDDASGTHLVDYQYLGLGTIVDANSPEPDIDLTYIQQSGDNLAPSAGGDQYTGLDQFGRVIDQNYIEPDTANPQNNTPPLSVDRFQYGYDADGNVLYENYLQNVSSFRGTNLTPTESELFTYNNLNQLTTFERGTLNSTDTAITGTPSVNESWTLDDLGDIKKVTTNGTAVTRAVSAQNQTTRVGTSSLSYDANGNTLKDSAGNTYTYDAWNRLVSVTTSGGTTGRYLYDAMGREIQSPSPLGTATETAAPVDLYYDSQGQVVQEQTAGGTEVNTNVWGQQYVNDLVTTDQFISGSNTTTRYYFTHDANFDTTAVISAGGAVQARYIYDPYGTVTQLGSGFGGSAPLYTVYLFQGMRLDTTSGLYHAGARDYNPSTGTWMEQDPAGCLDSANLYEFVQDGPIDHDDPQGTYTIVSQLNGGVRTYFVTRDWYHPALEGRKCCCNNPGVMSPPTITVGGWWDPVLSVNFQPTNCVSVVGIGWWTCVRGDDPKTSGVIPDAMGRYADVSFHSTNGVFQRLSGSYITHCELVVLVCVGNILRAGYWDVGTTLEHGITGWYMSVRPNAKFQWSTPGRGGPFSN